MKTIGIVKNVEKNDINIISSVKLKNGDFIAYKDRWVDNVRYILCRVAYSQSFKAYPDEFLMDSALSPKDILSFSGMDVDDYSRYLITANIVGYFNESLKEFKHPRTMPDSGEVVFLAEDHMLADISKAQESACGTANIGNVLGHRSACVFKCKRHREPAFKHHSGHRQR